MELTTLLTKAAIVGGGALAGYLYYRVIGCSSGVCPLTSTPKGSIFTGALIALLYVVEN